MPASKRLLLAEDDEGCRRVFTRRLTGAGYDVVAVASVAEATLVRGPIDGLVLDVRLGKDDGRQIKRLLFPTVPAVIISGTNVDGEPPDVLKGEPDTVEVLLALLAAKLAGEM